MKTLLITILSFVCISIPHLGTCSTYIPFQMVNGLIIVDAEVNGQKGSFIFDTGASDVLVDKSMGLPIKNEVEFVTSNGYANSGVVSIQNLKVGSVLEINNYSAFAIDLQNLKDYTSLNILGILGGQLFNGIVKVDFINSEISIITENSGIPTELKSAPLIISEGVPIIELSIEGKSCNFILDSGASAHVIDRATVLELKNVETLDSNKRLITAEGTSENVQVICINISFLEMDTNERFLMQDLSFLSKELNLPLVGILSLSSLKLDHLYLDFGTKRIYYQ